MIIFRAIIVMVALIGGTTLIQLGLTEGQIIVWLMGMGCCGVGGWYLAELVKTAGRR